MKRIKEIRIRNFKAFQQEQLFSIHGKNVLIFGYNGSGKSSLFWAIYTFLQSSIKTDDEIKKYFKYFVESDKSTHQTLRNVFMNKDEDAYIKVTSIETETAKEDVYTISQDTINTNLDSDTLIQELNLASDFINYKLLQNFYRGSHKLEVNLWPVFEHDIFPFLTEGTRNWLEDIIKKTTKDVPKTPSGRVVSRKSKQNYIDELETLNGKIQGLLTEITDHANRFLKDHFYKGKEVIRITLNFDKKFKFDLIRSKIWDDGRQAQRHNGVHIKLGVEIYDDTIPEKWRTIERVQSFLNEAQLTRIAIAVRVGALQTRPLKEARFKILVLDDMLISLDLSNRMDVVRILLNKDKKEDLKFFDEFQKIIFTHDKGFFNLIRRNTDEEGWVYFNFNKDENDNSAPKIKKNLSPIQKAIEYFDKNEFDACGNELRKEAEAILTNFLDPGMGNLNKEFKSLSDKIEKAFNKLTNQRYQKFRQTFLPPIEIEKLKKIKIDYSSDSSLSENDKENLDRLKECLFDFLIRFNEEKDRKVKLLEDVKGILDRIMNSASHYSENPLYRQELKDAIDKVKELKESLRKS